MKEGYALCFLCVLGFLKEFRPSESFLTKYLVGTKNFSQEQVSQEIYPIGTYSTLILLIIVFLVTDALCYKPVIILHCLSGVVCYCLITWCSAKEYVQVAEVFYGLFLASEVAYSTYMYASSEKASYRKVTSYTRIALQSGRLMSGLVGQLFISSLSFSAVFACLLPSTHRSLYFRKVGNETNGNVSAESPIKTGEETLHADVKLLENTNEIEAGKSSSSNKSHEYEKNLSGFEKIRRDFLLAFSNPYIVKWSVWWSLTQCGYLQVTSYIQNLWQDTVDVNNGELYNGFASAIYTILGIIASWLVAQLSFNVDEKKSQRLLCVCSLLSGALVILSTLSYSLYHQYVSYGLFKILHQVMMIFANTEVAKSLTRDSHGLIFGFNTFIALVVQTILTVIVTGKGGLQLSTRLQFFVYGAYYIAIGSVFCIMAFTTFTMGKIHSWQSKQTCSEP